MFWLMLFYYKNTIRILLSENRTLKMFARFRSGNFAAKDGLLSGRPANQKANEILQLVVQDRHVIYQGIALTLVLAHVTVWNHAAQRRTLLECHMNWPKEIYWSNYQQRNVSETRQNRMIFEVTMNNKLHTRTWNKKIIVQDPAPSATTSKSEFMTNKVIPCVWWK